MADVTITDYLILRDEDFELDGQHAAFPLNFDLPDDYVVGLNFAKPVIAYNVLPRNSVRLRFEFNNFEAEEVYLGERTWRGLWEAFPGDRLHPGPNEASVQIISGNALFSGIVLWFQRRLNI